MGRQSRSVAILAVADRTRVQQLVPISYTRMLASPFAFLRGAAAVMADDLKHQAIAGIPVQACGDCHLMNFGAFATPEENIVFDINDFDETLPGVDFTMDLKRLAASVAVAALAGNFSKKQARATTVTTVQAYRSRIRALAKLSPLEVWHSRIDLAKEIEHIEDRALRRRLYGIISKTDGRLEQDDNFPHLVKGKQARIEDRPPRIYHFHGKGDARSRVDSKRVFSGYQTRLAPERRCLVERYALADVASRSSASAASGFCAIGLFMSGDGALFPQIRKRGNRCSSASGRNSKVIRVSEWSRASA